MEVTPVQARRIIHIRTQGRLETVRGLFLTVRRTGQLRARPLIREVVL